MVTIINFITFVYVINGEEKKCSINNDDESLVCLNTDLLHCKETVLIKNIYIYMTAKGDYLYTQLTKTLNAEKHLECHSFSLVCCHLVNMSGGG